MSSTIRRVKFTIVAGSILTAVATAGCAATVAIHKGQDAEFRQEVGVKLAAHEVVVELLGINANEHGPQARGAPGGIP